MKIFFIIIYANNIINKEIDLESLAEKSKVIICMTSNLGLELASKGHKVFFFKFKLFDL